MAAIYYEQKVAAGNIKNYRGLINSRGSSQNFDNTKPGKWFSNANMCGGDNIWNEYADFHKIINFVRKRKTKICKICMQG